MSFPLRTPSALCSAGWTSSASSDEEDDHRRVSRRFPLVSRGNRPSVERGPTTFGSWAPRAITPLLVALDCVSVVSSDPTDVAMTGSSTHQGGPLAVHQEGGAILGAKLSGSNNDVPLSAAATGRRAHSTGSSGGWDGSIGYRPPPGRYPVWRRVCNQAPRPFGDVIRE
jgi:hypothetical protein